MLVSISISTPLLFGCDYVSHTYRRDDQIRYNGSSRYYEPRNPLEKLNLGKKEEDEEDIGPLLMSCSLTTL